MGSPFDNLEKAAHNAAMAVMGYPSSWTPSTGGDAIEGRMGIKVPTMGRDTQGKGFDPQVPMLEYLNPDFPGLFDNVREGKQEVVTVDGVDYTVFKATKKYDGDTVTLEARILE